jgi:hypothetical protein
MSLGRTPCRGTGHKTALIGHEDQSVRTIRLGLMGRAMTDQVWTLDESIPFGFFKMPAARKHTVSSFQLRRCAEENRSTVLTLSTALIRLY